MKCTRALISIRFIVLKRLFMGYAIPVVTGILALMAIVVYAESQTMAEPSKTPMLAASVNGVSIKLDELDHQVDNGLRKYKKYGVKQANDDLQKRLRKQALERLISVELLYQEASKIKVDDLNERVAIKLSELKKQNSGNAVFNEEGMRQIITRQVLIDEYLHQNKLKDSVLPESVVKDYYEKNKEQFRRNMSVRSRHILVGLAVDAKPEEKAAARDKIEEARKQILDGKPFGEIAKEYSDCDSASGGGELGYQEMGYMPKEFDDVAFSLETAKLSDIVETKFGYHLIEVLDRRPAGIQPFEEVKDFIGRYLNIQHDKKAMEEHLSALRKKAKIDIYL